MSKKENAIAKPTMLLMACCGPCACAVFAHDYHGEFDITMFFYGNHFDTIAEYNRRLDALRTVKQEYASNLAVIPYAARPDADCTACMRTRLMAAAQHAKNHNFDCFATSLSVSPHKDTALVNQLGAEVSKNLGISFIEMNLKKNNGFQKSVELSKRLGLYRQNYCGCARSVR